MRYEQEMLEKIMYYDREGIISTFPLYVYRTKGSISRKALEAAVGYAIQCHPRFGCRLAEDAKGPYLETNPEQPIIPELDPDEMFFYGDESNHYYPWIVGIHENEIIYTGFHGIADGIGATIFMRTVLYYYFKEQGIECDPGKAVTLQDVTPEYLERDTECTIRKNGTEDRPASYQPKPLQPSVFSEDLLEEPKSCAVHNIAINLSDVRKKSAEYEVSQFAVVITYVAQAVCDVLPGEENVVLLNIVTDMRRALNSITTHNCLMTVPVICSQHDLTGQSDRDVCKMFRSSLDQGYNRDEALHSCFNSVITESKIGGSKEYLAGAAAQISQRFGLNLPTASVAYTHLTRTGFSDELLGLLDDAYINYAGLRNEKKQAINAICAVTTDKVINLMLMDGTKNELILKALKKRLTENRIAFDDRVMNKYKGVFFKKS